MTKTRHRGRLQAEGVARAIPFPVNSHCSCSGALPFSIVHASRNGIIVDVVGVAKVFSKPALFAALNIKRRYQTAQDGPSSRLNHPLPMISFHRIPIFVALFAPLTTNVMSQSETPGAGGYKLGGQNIDAAYGVAFLDGG